MNEGSVELGVGLCVRPIAGEVVSGDACLALPWERRLVVGIADGLGHGPKAAFAAKCFLESLESTRSDPFEQVFARAHHALLHTRGAVAGVARIDETIGRLEIGVIGNISAGVLRAATGRTVHVLTVPGVLGSAYRTIRPQSIDLAAGDVLFMHSDGIRARSELSAIRSMPPQAAAEHVVRSAARASDDACCVVVRVQAPGIARGPAGPAALPPERGTSPRTFPIKIAGDAACAAAGTRAFAELVGLAPRAQWEASIVASELATNVLKYGGHGTLTLRHVQTPREALVLEVADEGDGIADIGSALIDGYSGGTQLLPDRRRNGQGLGVGLGTVHRLSDEVTIDSAPGRGTRVVVWKYLRK